MSHDFAFWDSDEPLENEEAAEVYASLLETGVSNRARPSARIATLAEEIQTRWPMPDRGSEDDWPLASPPEVTESHVLVCLVPSRLWDVWPTLGQLAKEHELIMYDPQQEHVFLPQRLSRQRTRTRAKKKQQPGR